MPLSIETGLWKACHNISVICKETLSHKHKHYKLRRWDSRKVWSTFTAKEIFDNTKVIHDLSTMCLDFLWVISPSYNKLHLFSIKNMTYYQYQKCFWKSPVFLLIRITGFVLWQYTHQLLVLKCVFFVVSSAQRSASLHKKTKKVDF